MEEGWLIEIYGSIGRKSRKDVMFIPGSKWNIICELGSSFSTNRKRGGVGIDQSKAMKPSQF